VENAPVCGAKRNNGELCTVRVRVAGERCWGHDPKNVEQRKQNARRAAQLKAQKPSELVEIKNTLRLADDVLGGKLTVGMHRCGPGLRSAHTCTRAAQEAA
jgi:hypothetical protein